MAGSGGGLSGIPAPELELILREIRRGNLSCPVSSSGLIAAGLGHLVERASALSRLHQEATSTVIEAILAERARPGTKVEPVWSGPEGKASLSRDTRVILRELLEGATTSVLIGGFVFDHGDTILKPLFDGMKERGVQASIYLHVKECPSGQDTEAHVRQEVGKFMEKNWTFGPPVPALYYDPRTVTSWTTLHAKCVVVDERRALITSANFTKRAQTKNIEVGVLIEDEHFARALVHQWRSAAEAGVFQRVTVTAAT